MLPASAVVDARPLRPVALSHGQARIGRTQLSVCTHTAGRSAFGVQVRRLVDVVSSSVFFSGGGRTRRRARAVCMIQCRGMELLFLSLRPASTAHGAPQATRQVADWLRWLHVLLATTTARTRTSPDT